MIRRPPSSPLFPYTTLSRSGGLAAAEQQGVEADQAPSGDVAHPAIAVEVAPPALEPLLVDRLVRVARVADIRSEEHTSEFQSRLHLVCRLLLEKKKTRHHAHTLLTLSAAADAVPEFSARRRRCGHHHHVIHHEPPLRSLLSLPPFPRYPPHHET